MCSNEIKDNKSFLKATQLTDQFAELEGRRPRIMLAKMGPDGYDHDTKVMATGCADVGFDVDIGPLLRSSGEVAKQAVENDVHVLAISSLDAGYIPLVPQVIEELKNYGREDIMVIVGGEIPTTGYNYLSDAGVVAIFGPGTEINETAIQVLKMLINSVD